jgi:hypothetical protein
MTRGFISARKSGMRVGERDREEDRWREGEIAVISIVDPFSAEESVKPLRLSPTNP